MVQGNQGGFIIINRKLIDWKWSDSPSALALWIHLLLLANWKTGYFHGETIQRGSLATSIDALAKETGLSPSTVKRHLNTFESDGQITRKASNRFTIITICKYNEYQDVEYLNQQMNQQMNHNRTNKQSNNNKKKYIKKKDILPEYMTNPEYGETNGNSTNMDNCKPEEIRQFIDSK